MLGFVRQTFLPAKRYSKTNPAKKYYSDPFSEPRLEVVEDEMRVLLRHVAQVWNVVSHHEV